jgi:transposase
MNLAEATSKTWDGRRTRRTVRILWARLQGVPQVRIRHVSGFNALLMTDRRNASVSDVVPMLNDAGKETTMPVPVLAEVIDAVVAVNSHHGTYEVQISSPAGSPIAAVSMSRDQAGYTDLLAWIMEHAPGPRLAVSGEGTSSYVAGLARAVAAVGLMVIECDHPPGKGHIDSTDVHCGDLTAVFPDADLLAISGTDGDRDALRILLGARQDMTMTIAEQSNRLRALLLGGDGTDRKIARAALTEVLLAGLARRRQPRDVTRQHCVRHAETRRLALSLFAAGCELRANTMQLQAIVDDLVPGLTDRRGIGPVGAAQAIVSLSHPSTVPRQRGARARRAQLAAS